MQRLVRARIAAAQLNTDLEMEEAQKEYELKQKQKEEQQANQPKESAILARLLDDDDI